MAGIKFGTSIGMAAMAGKADTDTTRLDLICPRAINKYINDPEELKGVIESIKVNGLISPITIVNIEEYLKSNGNENLSSYEREYYENELNKGRRYFITTGHRRFYAYCSVCIGRTISGPEELECFYKDFEEEERRADELIAQMEADKVNKFISIKAYVVKDDFYKERERYNSSNLDQRALQDFETIDNSLDDMKYEGKFDEAVEKFKTNKINEMSERQIKKMLEDNNIKFKNLEEGKRKLNNIPAERFSGYSKGINEAIKKYIKERRHKDVAETSIKYALLILKNLDEEMISYIYSGKLKYVNAREIQSFYPGLSSEEKSKLKEEIVTKSLNLKTWKREKTQEKHKVTISNRELIDCIKSVYKKDKTIEEVYDYLKSLNII